MSGPFANAGGDPTSAVPDVTWDSSETARAWLLSRQPGFAATLRALTDRLALAWQDPRPPLTLVGALGAVFPGCQICVSSADPSASSWWWIHDLDGAPAYGRPSGIVGHMSADPAVGLPSSLQGTGTALRTVIFDDDRPFALLGVHRWRSERAFSLEDRAALEAIQPIVHAFVRSLAIVGLAPLGEGTLADALDASSEAAFVLHEDRVVFANAVARATFRSLPAWLHTVELSARARVTPLVSGGCALTLVLPRGVSTDALPPSLLRTAELLARGLSDKEIAAELALSHATVRTYVTRIYERLGISDRRELMVRGRTS